MSCPERSGIDVVCKITSAVPLAGIDKIYVATLRFHRRVFQNGTRLTDGEASVSEQTSALGRPNNPYFGEWSRMSQPKMCFFVLTSTAYEMVDLAFLS